MKCFVRLPALWQAVLIGVGGLLLLSIVEAETVISHLIVAAIAVLLLRSEWISRRSEKNDVARQS